MTLGCNTHHMCGLLMLCAGLIAFTTTPLFAPLVGGTIDPFLADDSPRAVACRAALKLADELYGQLEPLPEGVTGEEQRQRVIEAYENAIAIMPEAPRCPDVLLHIAFLWKSTAVAPAEPAKALAAYIKVRKEYPFNDLAVIRAIGGQANALWMLKRPAAAARVLEEMYNYQLPEHAPLETVRMLHRLQTEMQLHLECYREEAERAKAAPRELLLLGEHRWQQFTDIVRATANSVRSAGPSHPPTSRPAS